MASTVGLVVKLVAKPEKAEDVAAFLAGALPLAQAEEGTLTWMATRTDATTFWIIDTFADDAGRTAHLEGPIAAALMENADALLSEAPQIMQSDVLAIIE